MKSVDQITVCMVDSGLFLPLAHCLSEQCDRVLVWSPDQRPWPSLRQAAIGSGYPNFDRVDEFWSMLDEIDLFVFPDIGQGALQEHLRDHCKKPVWGSGHNDELETDREYFMDTLENLGLDVPKFEVCEGWTALRDYLQDKEDCYVKISKFRGDMETTHWRSWELDENWLYWLATNFGSLKEGVRFLVFDAIDTDLEIGADTYCIDGQWPSKVLHGLEGKDKSYLACVTDTEAMPDQIRNIMAAFAPVLERGQYRNQWSMEVRVKEDKAFFIDATTRGGMPSSGSQQLIWKNFPDIIWHGAHGHLIEPEPVCEFAIETMITSKAGDKDYEDIAIPEELDRFARLSNCCFVDGKHAFPPNEFASGFRGWLVALGDTPKEALEKSKELADLLPDGLNADVEALAPIIEEVAKMEEEGIEFTDEPMPKPADVL